MRFILILLAFSVLGAHPHCGEASPSPKTKVVYDTRCTSGGELVFSQLTPHGYYLKENGVAITIKKGHVIIINVEPGKNLSCTEVRKKVPLED